MTSDSTGESLWTVVGWRRFVRRCCRLAATSLCAPLLASCGCDTIGCIDGVIVGLSSEPPTPWRVELFVDGVSQPAGSDAFCAGPNHCGTGVLFNISATRAVVRVTTPAGVRNTEYTAIRYVRAPRGSGCTACRGQAQVVAEVP